MAIKKRIKECDETIRMFEHCHVQFTKNNDDEADREVLN